MDCSSGPWCWLRRQGALSGCEHSAPAQRSAGGGRVLRLKLLFQVERSGSCARGPVKGAAARLAALGPVGPPLTGRLRCAVRRGMVALAQPAVRSRVMRRWMTSERWRGVIADAKHFAANNQETDRLTVNAVVGERALREIYTSQFEKAVKRGGALSVMCAYN